MALFYIYNSNFKAYMSATVVEAVSALHETEFGTKSTSVAEVSTMSELKQH